MSPENRAHTHSLMVEKPFSSSCLRSITAVSLKPPPELFSAAFPSDHQTVPSLSIIDRQKTSTPIDERSASFQCLDQRPHVRHYLAIGRMSDCRDTAVRERFNADFWPSGCCRRSAVTGWLVWRSCDVRKFLCTAAAGFICNMRMAVVGVALWQLLKLL